MADSAIDPSIGSQSSSQSDATNSIVQPSSQAVSTSQSGATPAKEREPSRSNQVVEASSTPEPILESVDVENEQLDPELAEYVSEIKNSASQLPTTVTVKGDQLELSDGNVVYPKEQIVLPISESELKAHQKANPQDSRRWLAEFVKKIINMFPGSTVFKPQDQ